MGAIYIRLSEAEDKQLQQIEANEALHKKVRLRAQVVRLSHRQLNAEEIAVYLGRSYRSVLRDLQRWEGRGVEGLADSEIPGQRSPLGEVEKAYIRERLAENRAWTATTLAEAVNKQFRLKVNRESMRVCLLELGYTWQRQRYVPIKTLEAKRLSEAKETLDGFKKKLRRVNSS
jgi:transposase